jgi:glycosyltransferase involved in cell wall biosynthesis
MNICMLAPFPPQKGGVPVHASRVARLLSQRHDVTVVTYGRLGRHDDRIHMTEIRVPGIGFLRGLVFLILSVAALFSIARKRDIDVIHAHYMHPPGTAAVIYGKISRKRPKIIITAHGSDLVRMARLPLGRTLLRRIGNSCDTLVCVSNYLASAAASIGIEESRVRVVYNGRPECGRIGKAARKRLGLPAVKRIITFAGALERHKGADVFIEEAAKMSWSADILFVLVGDGSMRPRLEEMCREKGIESSVLFAGGRTHEEALYYIAASDILAVTSKSEGFGLAALEAACLGVPVVAVTAGALGEVVSPLSLTENVSATCLEVLRDAKLRGRIVSENMKKCMSFDWRSSVNELERIYRASS